MDQLQELFKQMQELAGVGLDMLQGAKGGDKGGAPHEGGAPHPGGDGGPPKEGGAPHPGGDGGPPKEGGSKPPPFGR
jgi:hypothetical protein